MLLKRSFKRSSLRINQVARNTLVVIVADWGAVLLFLQFKGY